MKYFIDLYDVLHNADIMIWIFNLLINFYIATVTRKIVLIQLLIT